MMIYEIIKNVFQNALGTKFILDYNNNLETDWKEILHEDDFIHCVMRVDSGRTTYVSDKTIKTDILHISFAIPYDKEVFDEAIGKIELIRDSLNDTTVATGENSFAKILMQYRTEGREERVNGVDWVMTDLYFEVQEYVSIFTSDDREVKINGDVLGGILNTTYDYNKQLDSYVKGVNVGATNRINSCQKQLLIDVVPSADNTVLKNLHDHEEENITYTIAYKDGYRTRTFTAILVRIQENVITGDIIKNQISFVESK